MSLACADGHLHADAVGGDAALKRLTRAVELGTKLFILCIKVAQHGLCSAITGRASSGCLIADYFSCSKGK